MRILTVNSWLGPEERWIWRHIDDAQARFDYVGRDEMLVKYQMTRVNRLLRYDGGMFLLGLRALARMHAYDAVVCSHLSFGAPLGFMRGLFGLRKPPQVVMTFIIHDIMRRRLPLLRVALSGMQQVVCHSRPEVEIYPRLLRANSNLFTYIPFGVDTDSFRPSWPDDQGYVLALGQESRDYCTFFEAIRELPYPVVVVASDKAVEGLEIPPSVSFRNWLSFKNFIRTVEGARCVVIPLEPKEYSSGQQAFLSAMALGKPVIVTETTGSVDYIESGDTGFLVPPRDAGRLRERIASLMEDKEACRRVGKQSRQKVEDEFSEVLMSRRVYDLVKAVTDRGR